MREKKNNEEAQLQNQFWVFCRYLSPLNDKVDAKKKKLNERKLKKFIKSDVLLALLDYMMKLKIQRICE